MFGKETGMIYREAFMFVYKLIIVIDFYQDVDRTWENIKENIQTSAKERLALHEFKQNKPWFDEECLGFWIKGSGLKCSGYGI